MSKVFVDTWAWLALLNDRDQQNRIAQKALVRLHEEKRQLVTSEFVLMEVADALSAPNLRERTVAFVNELRQNPMVQIFRASELLWQSAWELYSSRPDKGWGLTDCTSFVIMEQQEIRLAFTGDRHFTQAGFEQVA